MLFFAFPAFSKPFVVWFVADANELNTPESANRGFHLNFNQKPCLSGTG